MEKQGRCWHVSQLARWSWREGERRCCGPCETNAEFDRIRRADLRHSEQNALRDGEESGRTICEGRSGLGDGSRYRAAQNMPDDFRVSITDAPGEKTYPIVSFTWLLIPEKFSDATKLKVMKDFLQWMLTDGQKMTEALAYAPLPKEVIAKEQQALAKMR